MASWICSICSFAHGHEEPICFGCHHPGTSLEHFIDCPKCGRETKEGGPWCDWCQEPFDDDDGELNDDELDDEDLDDDFEEDDETTYDDAGEEY